MSELLPPSPIGPSVPEPPAPGETDTSRAVPQAKSAGGAWATLTHALGHDLQRGLWRAEQARRRMVRGG